MREGSGCCLYLTSTLSRLGICVLLYEKSQCLYCDISNLFYKNRVSFPVLVHKGSYRTNCRFSCID